MQVLIQTLKLSNSTWIGNSLGTPLAAGMGSDIDDRPVDLIDSAPPPWWLLWRSSFKEEGLKAAEQAPVVTKKLLKSELPEEKVAPNKSTQIPG